MAGLSTKPAREVATKTNDPHSPSPKKTKEMVPGEFVAKMEPAVAASLTLVAEPQSMSQVLATLRSEMSHKKHVMKNELVEVRASIDDVGKQVDAMQVSVNRAFAPIAERVEQRDRPLLEHDELPKAIDIRIEAQNTAMAQLHTEILELRTTQSLAEATVKEVRQEMAMPPDAPPPPLTRASGGWGRTAEPHVLQANASAMFSAAALVESLTPLAEAANLTLDDVCINGAEWGPQWLCGGQSWSRGATLAPRRVVRLCCWARVGTAADGGKWT